MKIISWNVNGLRACVKKGFHSFLDESNADVVALQEVRAFPDQLELNTRTPEGWHAFFTLRKDPGTLVYLYILEKSRQMSYLV